MRTILVTGATGFLGSHLVAACVGRGFRVLAQARRPVRPRLENVVAVQSDLRDLAPVRDAVARHGCDAIAHLAARLPGHGPCAAYAETNVLGSAALLDLFAECDASHFVLASSLYLIGKPGHAPVTEAHAAIPAHPYYASKLAAEAFCQACAATCGKPATALRLSAPYGAGMPETVLLTFLRAAVAGNPIRLHGCGKRVQNFIHVRDACRAFLHALHLPAGLFLSGGESVSMAELGALALRLAGRETEVPAFSGQPDPQEDYRWIVDAAKLRQTGFELSVPLEQGCAELVSRLRAASAEPPWWRE